MTWDRLVAALVVAMIALNMGVALFMALTALVLVARGQLDIQLGVPICVGLVVYWINDQTLQAIAPMVRRLMQ